MRSFSLGALATLRKTKRDLVSDWKAWSMAERSVAILTMLAMLATPLGGIILHIAE